MSNHRNTGARFAGKRALITGAARGQGRRHAVRLAEEGADIVAFDIDGDDDLHYRVANRDDMAETVRQVEALGRRIIAETADVRDRARLGELLAGAVDALGGLDIVVANAGICPLGADAPATAFSDAVDVNLVGAINTVSVSLPHLRSGAAVVVTGSVAAFQSGTVDRAGPGGLGYRASKRMVAQYVHDLAHALAPERIRVNAVHPTNCDTDMLHNEALYQRFRPDLERPTRADAEVAFVGMTAMGVPWVEPDDVSDAVLFLASDEARYITGMQLRVDAGFIAKITDHF